MLTTDPELRCSLLEASVGCADNYQYRMTVIILTHIFICTYFNCSLPIAYGRYVASVEITGLCTVEKSGERCGFAIL
jgi:hypothetical protein